MNPGKRVGVTKDHLCIQGEAEEIMGKEREVQLKQVESGRNGCRGGNMSRRRTDVSFTFSVEEREQRDWRMGEVKACYFGS